MKLYLAIVFVLAPLFSLNNDLQRKIISDSEFSYTFYVTTKNKTKKIGPRFYYWFKSGEIHSSQGGSSGDLLHGDFTKSYKNNNLAEQGRFKNGLKDKLWKRWHSNGQLYEITRWNNGIRTGKYVQFSEGGEMTIQGAFKNSKKHGVWVSGVSKDTVFYKNGEEIARPKKYDRPPFTKRAVSFVKELFKNKRKDSLAQEPKIEKEKKTSKKQVEKVKKKKKSVSGNRP